MSFWKRNERNDRGRHANAWLADGFRVRRRCGHEGGVVCMESIVDNGEGSYTDGGRR